MAGIDRIYGSNEQYNELKNFLVKYNRSAIKYLYPTDCFDSVKHRPISSFPQKVDQWLLKYCKMNWVVERIQEQYNITGKVIY